MRNRQVVVPGVPAVAPFQGGSFRNLGMGPPVGTTSIALTSVAGEPVVTTSFVPPLAGSEHLTGNGYAMSAHKVLPLAGSSQQELPWVDRTGFPPERSEVPDGSSASALVAPKAASATDTAMAFQQRFMSSTYFGLGRGAMPLWTKSKSEGAPPQGGPSRPEISTVNRGSASPSRMAE
jgi:hypothetical protein